MTPVHRKNKPTAREQRAYIEARLVDNQLAAPAAAEVAPDIPARNDDLYTMSIIDVIGALGHVFRNKYPTIHVGDGPCPAGEIETTTPYIQLIEREMHGRVFGVLEIHAGNKQIRIYNEALGSGYDVLIRMSNDTGWHYTADKLVFNDDGAFMPCRGHKLEPWQLPAHREESPGNKNIDLYGPTDANERIQEVV